MLPSCARIVPVRRSGGSPRDLGGTTCTELSLSIAVTDVAVPPHEWCSERASSPQPWRCSPLRRALLSTLLLARGVPLLLGGDELGRTQGGNNNAYCQDNPVSWIDWDGADAETLGFFRHVLRLRQAAVLRRGSFFTGSSPPGSRLRDVCWLHPSGRELGPQDWASGQALGMLLGGDAIGDLDGELHDHGRDALNVDLHWTLKGKGRARYLAPPARSTPAR